MFLYIDPGTGSMLFTILIGLLGAAIYALKGVYLKSKLVLGVCFSQIQFDLRPVAMD